MEEAIKIHYAGFWIRVLAAILDTIWLFGIIYTVLYFIGVNIFSLNSTFNFTKLIFEYIIPAVIVVIFWMYKSATPGKIVLKLKIVDSKTFGEVPNSRLLIRYLGYYIGIFPFFLGLFWVGWDKRKQGWHDKMAGTVVIVENELSTTPNQRGL